MKNNKVSIIVRTHNRILFLKRAIESICNQSYKDWEILIINNAGEIRKLEQFLNIFREKHNNVNIILVNTANILSRGAALNKGIEVANGSYITILDDDDTWEKDFLLECINKLYKNAELDGIITTNKLIFEEVKDNQIIQLKHADFNSNLKSVTLYSLAKGNLFTINSFVYKREVLNKTGLYREDLLALEDWEFNIRFFLYCKAELINKQLTNYHKRLMTEELLYTNSDIKEHLMTDEKIRKEYIRKCWDLKFNHKTFAILIYGWGQLRKLKQKIFLK